MSSSKLFLISLYYLFLSQPSRTTALALAQSRNLLQVREECQYDFELTLYNPNEIFDNISMVWAFFYLVASSCVAAWANRVHWNSGGWKAAAVFGFVSCGVYIVLVS